MLGLMRCVLVGYVANLLAADYQQTEHRTEHTVTLHFDIFCMVPEQFPEHPVTCHVPIATLVTCRTAGLRTIHLTPCIVWPTTFGLLGASNFRRFGPSLSRETALVQWIAADQESG